ncbi:hypothetical protein GGS20DRAFT_586492 [Poronia punctata]|nr:hypothetical protein GGS20DRAFT_586492 [Poronia punctata]
MGKIRGSRRAMSSYFKATADLFKGAKEWYKNFLFKGDEYLLDKFQDRGYLGVWDVPVAVLGNDGPPPDVSHAATPLAVYHGGPDSDSGGVLAELQAQPANTVRIFVDELYYYGGYRSRVDGLLGIGEGNSRIPETGFRALCSQFRSSNGPWARMQGYSYLSDRKRNAARILRNTRLIVDMRRNVKAVINERYHNWARTERDFAFGTGKDGQRIVFISCQTYVSRRMFKSFEEHRDRFPVPVTSDFVGEFRGLEQTYAPLRTDTNWRQVVCLQYHHACLNLFTDFMTRLVREYIQYEGLALNPKDSRLQKWHHSRFVEDALFYRNVEQTGAIVVETLESLLELNRNLASRDPHKDRLEPQLSILTTELQGCCKDIRRLQTRLLGDLEQDLKYLDLARSLKETESVQRLTLLATIFLPPSLASAILSMQTRFQDLGYLLYDFFGVLVLISAVALLGLGLFSVLNVLGETVSMFRGIKIYRYFIQPVLLLTGGTALAIYFSLVLSSFLVGMFKDVVLGSKVLGYGTAVAIFGPVVLCIVIGGSIFLVNRLIKIISSWITHLRNAKVPNVEEGQVEDDDDDNNNNSRIEAESVPEEEHDDDDDDDDARGETNTAAHEREEEDVNSPTFSEDWSSDQLDTPRPSISTRDDNGITRALAMSGVLD